MVLPWLSKMPPPWAWVWATMMYQPLPPVPFPGKPHLGSGLGLNPKSALSPLLPHLEREWSLLRASPPKRSCPPTRGRICWESPQLSQLMLKPRALGAPYALLIALRQRPELVCSPFWKIPTQADCEAFGLQLPPNPFLLA